MSSWATIEKPELVNFADIVFEEKLRNLQKKKKESAVDVTKILDQNITIKESGNAEDRSCSYLRDQKLKHSNNTNEELQVPLLFNNNCQEFSLKKELENNIQGELKAIQNNEDIDVPHPLDNELISAASYGYKLRNSGKMIVKHDVILIEKKNTSKTTPELQIKKNFIEEDLFDLKLSYKFFKNLRIHFRIEEDGNCEVRDKEKRVFDLILYSGSVLHDFITNGLLHSTYYVLNSGNKAVILYGTFGSSSSYSYRERPKKCAIKYFKIKDPDSKQCIESICLSEEEVQREITTNLWQAEKEMSNLLRASMAGVACPEIIKVKRNVLVMSFIGKYRKPAPKLKYAELRKSNFISAYEQVRDAMKRLYEKANLIHGDLTEYNILWYNDQCYFIDFSQSVESSHENAFYVLLTDCIKITSFFRKRIHIIDPPEELFKFITGFHYGNKIVLERMEKLYQRYPHVFHKPDDIDTASEEVVYQQEMI